VFLYAAPELRFGGRFGDHFEISVGVAVRVFATVSQPSWQDVNPVTQGPPGGQGGDGEGGFGKQTMIGSFVFDAEPGIGMRYSF
jgi:hypothetical protein